MDTQSPPQRAERITKWTLHVAKRRHASTICRAAKVTFVAIRRVGVGPGVKIDSQRSVTKDAIGKVGLTLCRDEEFEQEGSASGRKFLSIRAQSGAPWKR